MARTRTKKGSTGGHSALSEMVQEIRAVHNLRQQSTGIYGEDGIADIITFCNHPDLLNLPASKLNLFMSQKVVLKCLYMGSRGNKELQLDADEWEWLYEREDVYETKEVIEKLKERERSNFRFSELSLIIGRRSSKTVLASIIAVYEAYKILMVGGGDPYEFYQIPNDQEIAIINLANSGPQAQRLFSQIKARLRGSKFFQGRVDEPISASCIKLFTDFDIKRKREGGNNVKIEGTIHLVCGHSNPNTLRGYTSICIIFDELGFYDEGTKVSGSEFYEALTPPVSQFTPYGDGLIVEISTPGPKTGILYKLWKQSWETGGHLSFRMPTWLFNPNYAEDNDELVKAKKRDKAKYDVEYGSVWPESGLVGFYFPEKVVDRCLEMSEQLMIMPEDIPTRGGEYYMHVDPALTGNNYAAVIVRKQMYRNTQGIVSPRVVLSKVMVWYPETNHGLNYLEIDQAILDECLKFRPTIITYDQWNSEGSMQMLRRRGFNVRKTSFGRGYKNKIFQNLRDLMIQPELGLYLWEHPLLVAEMRNIKYRGLPSGQGQNIGADPRGECPTDDCMDCLAGAAFMACGNYHNALPAGVLVYTGWR